MEDPITALKNAGYSDLATDFARGIAQPYSFVFRGEWGYLDYVMASASMATQVTGVTEWHINADEPRALDYNTEFKTPGQVTAFYASDAYRASDHDPLVVTINVGVATAVELATSNAPISATPVLMLVILMTTLGVVSVYLLRKRA